MILSTNFLNKTAVVIMSAVVCISFSCAHTQRTTVPAEKKMKIAVFPLENLSSKPAPMKEIRRSFIEKIEASGIDVLEDMALEQFMSRHRVRYVGGVDNTLSVALKKEEGIDAVLITSLELYDDRYPPKIGLISRLVRTGEGPAILWIESIGLAGDNSPGLLGLGLIDDPSILREKAVRLLVGSLEGYFSEEKTAQTKIAARYRPKILFQSLLPEEETKYTAVIVPFFNLSLRKNAGEIMLLHFAEKLSKDDRFEVIEPGVVRQKLLNVRVIMNEGVSLSDADIIANSLGADLVFSGKVFDYQDYAGTEGKPKVDFSMQAIERKSKKVVWASKSYNQGDDGVFFFDAGRINTAGVLASEMAGSAVNSFSIDNRQKTGEIR
jgi:hypothetical protein